MILKIRRKGGSELKETKKEKLAYWQPEGIEWLQGTRDSRLIMASVHKDSDSLELVIKDESNNAIKIVYNQISSAEFAVWGFVYDTHAGRPELWAQEAEEPEGFSNEMHTFFKIIDWSDLSKYQYAPIYQDIWNTPEVHLYSTRDEFFIVVSDYEPVITKIK